MIAVTPAMTEEKLFILHDYNQIPFLLNILMINIIILVCRMNKDVLEDIVMKL